jgi:hypothetical protein
MRRRWASSRCVPRMTLLDARRAFAGVTDHQTQPEPMAALQTVSFTKVRVQARVAVRAPKATVVCKASSSKAEVSTRRGMLSLGLMAAIAATAPKAKADLIGARSALSPPSSLRCPRHAFRATQFPCRSLVLPGRVATRGVRQRKSPRVSFIASASRRLTSRVPPRVGALARKGTIGEMIGCMPPRPMRLRCGDARTCGGGMRTDAVGSHLDPTASFHRPRSCCRKSPVFSRCLHPCGRQARKPAGALALITTAS